MENNSMTPELEEFARLFMQLTTEEKEKVCDMLELRHSCPSFKAELDKLDRTSDGYCAAVDALIEKWRGKGTA